jgi:hypothetical protein
MQHVQGYTRSLWMPSSGNYLLCIAPAAAGATANTTAKKKCTNFAGHFDGRFHCEIIEKGCELT